MSDELTKAILKLDTTMQTFGPKNETMQNLADVVKTMGNLNIPHTRKLSKPPL